VLHKTLIEQNNLGTVITFIAAIVVQIVHTSAADVMRVTYTKCELLQEKQ
jgi:hypothetical protein